MILFKIISDPYKREIKFETVDSETLNPENLDFEKLDSLKTTPVTEADNCDLVSDEIVHGFFPYNVKKIIDEIYAMKAKKDQPVHIIFEGTDDEYSDLKELCYDEYYHNKIILCPQMHYLNSAKDILPKISEIFQEMQPLIEESVRTNKQVAHNRRKFEDAVDKQMIPICVIGNYSSGKSTFINALVGKEILPSGDDPVTDCVYQITRSQNAETGCVEFEYRGLPVRFAIDEYNHGEGCNISGAGKCNDEFITSVQQKLDEISSETIHIRIHALLALIEEHKKKRKRENAEKDIDSLIKITLPFSKEGVLSQSQCRYVIFDTPGEGSATNVDHSETLERQMRSLSNGLIMFITDNKSLDKIEGRDLCEKLINMECFDNRFTMVVANRADCAKLPKDGFQEEDIENKLSQTVCQTLRSQRIFYVSSIVGLGSKLGDDFLDEDYQEVYDKEIDSYTNPDAKHPKALYRYDIIPGQIKRRCYERSEHEPNRAFANSGLFWIEQEIRVFAEIHSPYNKCTQSKHFLDEIIAETSARIDENRKGFEASKQTLNEKLESEQSVLIDFLENRAHELCTGFSGNYPTPNMKTIVDNANEAIGREELEQRQSEIRTVIERNYNYASQKEDARFFKTEANQVNENSGKTIFYKLSDTSGDNKKKLNYASNVQNEKKSVVGNLVDAVKNTAKKASDVLQSTQDTIDKKIELRKLNKRIESETAEDLFSEITGRFDSEIGLHQINLESESENYWSNASEEFRVKMINAVTNSEGISEEKKNELEEIIANFEALKFERVADKVFKFDEFKKHIFIVVETNSLNLSKLRTKYNTLMHDHLTEMQSILKNSHETSFISWEESLLQELKKNIIKLNPELRKLQEQIDAQAAQISNLQNRKDRLLEYQLEIEHLMSWN